MPILLAYGFRPFFLLACGAALLAVAPLPLVWLGLIGFGGPWPVGVWHAHEQIFGFLAAALAGFLLTALPSWTGTRPVTGKPLAALVALWAVGRLALWASGVLPPLVVAVLDLLFLPALLLACLPALRVTENRPWEFVVALGGLIAANVAFHAGEPERAVAFALSLFLVLIALALGRILPVTLRSALMETDQAPMVRFAQGRRHLTVVTLALFAGVEAMAPASAVSGWVALAAACAQMDRLGELHRGRALLRPQVLFFYIAQAWIVFGLVGLGLTALLGGVEATAFRHALGIGATGTVALMVMSIVALRHTGRGFPLPVAVWLAPALVGLAAVLRVAVPVLHPAAMPWLGVTLPAVLWVAAFAAYALVFGPWLLRPRVDGEPG